MHAVLLTLVCLSLTTRASGLFPPTVRPHGTFVTIGTHCDNDYLCGVAGMVCWHHSSGIRGSSRCACKFGHTWDATHMRCINPQGTSRTILTISRNASNPGGGNALVYREHVNAVARTVNDVAFPGTWSCDPISRYCWAEDERVRYATATSRDYWQVRVAHLGLTTIPIENIIWQCKDGYTYTPLNEDATSTAEEPHGGLRDLRSMCTTCAEGRVCKAMGQPVCQNGVHTGCAACISGWSGAFCTNKLTATTRDMYRSDVTCDPVGANTCGANQLCYRAAGVATGVCECAPGFIPDTATTGTCIALSMFSTARGVLINGSVHDVHYSSVSPSSVWWFPTPTTQVYAWVLRPVEIVSHQWIPRPVIPVRTRCINNTYFHDPHGLDHCAGVYAICGEGANATASDPATGTCVCASGYLLHSSTNRCDACEGGDVFPGCTVTAATCATAECSTHGSCPTGGAMRVALMDNQLRLPQFQLDPMDSGVFTTTRLPPACICGITNATDCLHTADCITVTGGSTSDIVVTMPIPAAISEIYANLPTWSIRRIEGGEHPCVCEDQTAGNDCEISAEVCTSHLCSSRYRHVCQTSEIGTECACAMDPDTNTVAYGRRCESSPSTCRDDRCNGHGRCAFQNQGCICDYLWLGHDCAVPRCLNGADHNDNGTACDCGRDLDGTHCETWLCGDYSRYNDDGECVCTGMWSINTETGKCTNNRCGSGSPHPYDPTRCICAPDYAFSLDPVPICVPLDCGQGSIDAENGRCKCKSLVGGRFCDDTTTQMLVIAATVIGFFLVVWFAVVQYNKYNAIHQYTSTE